MSRRISIVIVCFVLAVLVLGQVVRSSLIDQNVRTMVCAARLAQIAQATISYVYVKDGATGTNSGGDWTNAYTDLQAALTTAGSNTEIWVAQGTYKPASQSSSFTFNTSNSGVEVYGGFRGYPGDEGIMDGTTRPLDSGTGRPALASILSGDLSGNDGSGPPDATTGADNCFHVVTAIGASSDTKLDGCTIQNGYSSNSNSSETRRGAGLSVTGSGSSPLIAFCTFRNNIATASDSGSGGAVAVNSSGSASQFLNCLFQGNQSKVAGGALAVLGSAGADSVTIQDCRFEGNSITVTSGSGDRGGGAVYFNSATTSAVIENSDFEDNASTVLGGGAIASRCVLMNVHGCSFTSNTANLGSGGAIHVSSGGAMTIKISTFTENHCVQSATADGGGAIGIKGDAGAQHIVNCQFFGNVAEPTSTDSKIAGGAIWSGNTGSVGPDALDITNCLFVGNVAGKPGSGGEAGAIYCADVGNGPGVNPETGDYGIFTNLTMVSNHANIEIGGIALATAKSAKVVNCILWDNDDLTGSGSEAQLQVLGGGDVDYASYSCIMGGYTGTGNISSDPLFGDTSNVDYSLRNYRLQPCSPASDAGDYDAIVTAADPTDLNNCCGTSEPTPLDLDLVDRKTDNSNRTNGGHGTYTYTDMGAYEYHAPSCSTVGDINGDSVVNGLDIQPFLDCVLALSTNDACACADLNVDDRCDPNDVTCLVGLLLNEANGCVPNCGAYLIGLPDCDTDGVPDVYEIANGTSQDCNVNGVPDECDIDEGDPDGNELVSNDVNTNGIPDECEADCNKNGVPDDWDISQTTSADANTNGVPDECEGDCNHNGIPDDKDIAEETSADCNVNGMPDECEPDCNSNGVPDDCDVDPEDPDGDEWVSPDCNGNEFPDECDLAIPAGFGGSLDCNTNGVPDECDIASCESDPACGDCNSNGIPDACDIAAEISTDADTNGVPDECESEMMMMGGEESTAEGGYAPEAWEAFYDWSAEQCWGPACEDPMDVQFAAMVAKLQELGLPVKGHP